MSLLRIIAGGAILFSMIPNSVICLYFILSLSLYKWFFPPYPRYRNHPQSILMISNSSTNTHRSMIVLTVNIWGNPMMSKSLGNQLVKIVRSTRFQSAPMVALQSKFSPYLDVPFGNVRIHAIAIVVIICYSSMKPI